jgi:hypothetical protein
LAAQGRLLHRGTADPLPWLVRADLFLFPSAREGMGVALAEALAVGVPSIVSASPGLNWARALPGVLSVDDRVNTWCEAISGHNRDSLLPALPPEFTAVAGVAKYGRLYQGLVSQRGKKLRTETAHAYDCC